MVLIWMIDQAKAAGEQNEQRIGQRILLKNNTQPFHRKHAVECEYPMGSPISVSHTRRTAFAYRLFQDENDKKTHTQGGVRVLIDKTRKFIN